MSDYADHLEQAFEEFWARNSTLRGGLPDHQSSDHAIYYYTALGRAIQQGEYQALINLLIDRIPPPPEFLPDIAELFKSNLKHLKQLDAGRRPKFIRVEKYFLYLDMKHEIQVLNKNPTDVFREFAEKITAKGEEIDPVLFRRIWEECNADPKVSAISLPPTKTPLPFE